MPGHIAFYFHMGHNVCALTLRATHRIDLYSPAIAGPHDELLEIIQYQSAPTLGRDLAWKDRLAALKLLEDKPEVKSDRKRWGYLETSTGDDVITLDFDRGCREYNIIFDQATGLPMVVSGNNKLFHCIILEEARTKQGMVATVKVYVPGLSRPWSLLQDDDRIVIGSTEYEYHDSSRPKASKEGAFETYRIISKTKEERGSFGIVKVVMSRKTPKLFALKIIEARARRGLIDKPTYEISSLKALNHPNICKLEEFFLCTDNTLHLILEHAPEGTLLDKLKSPETFQFDGSLLPHKAAGTIMLQLCTALEYIHAQGLIHRDVKPDNILVASNVPLVIKVADFGGTIPVVMVDSHHHSLPFGNFEYMAPEVAKGEQYDNRVDAYGVGVIFHKMVLLMCGIEPPTVEKQNAKDLIEERGTNLWRILRLKNVHHADRRAQSLAEGLLQERVFERFSMSDTLKHRWLLPVKEENAFRRIRTIPTEEYNHGTIAVIAEVGNNDVTSVAGPPVSTTPGKTPTRRRPNTPPISVPPSRFSLRLKINREKDAPVRRSQRLINRERKRSSRYCKKGSAMA